MIRILIALFFFFVPAVHAATHTASSCSQADVQSAINSVASDGDVVQIPACSPNPTTWTTGVSRTTTVEFTIQGSGQSTTQITYTGSGTMFGFSGVAGSSYDNGFRGISNMTVDGNGDSTNLFLQARIAVASPPELEIYNMTIGDFKTAMQIKGYYGVIYDNTFNEPSTASSYGIYAELSEDQTWDTSTPTFGTRNALFIEDNTITGYCHFVSGFCMSSYVFRYNTVTESGMTHSGGCGTTDVHGPGYQGCYPSFTDFYAGRLAEVYNNDITMSNDSGPNEYYGAYHRAGSGIITANTYTNTDHCIDLNSETGPNGGCVGPDCNPPDCTIDDFDNNNCTDSGDACCQKVDDYYVWDNTCTSTNNAFIVTGVDTDCLREDYEYYLRAPTTLDDGFTWTAFTYPHPLTTTNYYIDPSAGVDGSGTFASPYNTWVGKITANSDDDYRQKCGTTYPGSVTITTSGTSGDHIVIGAYNADGSHEDGGNEIFGENCSGGDAKPIITDSDQVGSAIDINASYIELNSVQAKKGETTIYVDGHYNNVKYCRIMEGIGGIRFGLSSESNNNYVGYNYVYGYDDNPDTFDLDGIQFANVDDSIIEYNIVDGYAHSGIATTSAYADDNEIRYNTVYSWNDDMDQFATINGTGNKFHHNYCFDCGIITLYRSVGNYIYSNVIDGLTSNSYLDNNSAIMLQPLTTGANVTDNKVYNNTIYDRRDGFSNPKGIMLFSSLSAGGVIERNEIYNNIFLNFDTTSPVINVLDWYDKIESNSSDEDVNLFRNNLVYGWTGSDVARIEGINYTYITDQNPPASYFNSYGAASNNLDSDPGLKDPVNNEFWPDDANDDAVGTGCDMNDSGSDCYDSGYTANESILFYTTDFTASPPDVDLDIQPVSWYIGAYSLEELVDTTDPVVTISTSDPSNIGEDTLAIAGTVTDAGGIVSCKYRIGAAPDASNGTLINDYETSPISWDGTATGFEVGANTLYVGCADPSGNWGSSSIVVNLSGLGVTRFLRSGGSKFGLVN